MKRLMFVSLLSLGSYSSAFAQTIAIQGSDTLATFMTDVIIASGLEERIVYQGGGSGKGEEAIAAGTQAIAPMSRPVKAEVIEKAKAAGIAIVEHVIGLDGIGIFANAKNTATKVDLAQLKAIYSCEVTNWSDLGGADKPIVVYRRNDSSGTTDTFKSLVGIKTFGQCVKVVAETADIAVHTSEEEGAIGYAGLSALRDENQTLAVAVDSASKAYLPLAANIRASLYPLARKLYVYEAAGALTPNEVETQLLNNILDRSFADSILVDSDFFTID